MLNPDLKTLSNPYNLLDFWAENTPDNLALVSPAASYSFSSLRDSVDAVALYLLDSGVAKGDYVFTALPSEGDWITSLALARLGACSVSGSGLAEDLEDLFDFGVFTEASLPKNPVQYKTITITQSEFELDPEILAISRAVELEPEQIIRGFLTGAWNGQSKIAQYWFSTIKNLLDKQQATWSLDSELNLFSPASFEGYGTALLNLNAGKPWFTLGQALAPQVVAKFLHAQRIQTLTGTPFMVSRLLGAIREENLALPNLKSVRLVGPNLSEQLFEFLTRGFNVQVTRVYGFAETGAVFENTIRHSSELKDLGDLVEESSVRLLTDFGTPVIPGDPGLLAVKKENMFNGYMGEPEGTNMVADTFVPGDLVSWNQGRYYFEPRDSEILNVGGLEINVSGIENFAISLEEIEEALAFEIVNQNGRPDLGIAIVSNTPQPIEAIAASFKQNMPESLPAFYAQVPFIPRDSAGKPQRAFLTKEFSQPFA
jgi:acyl-coenzyme A synthetase/AMP-(fatty) acid ligase